MANAKTWRVVADLKQPDGSVITRELFSGSEKPAEALTEGEELLTEVYGGVLAGAWCYSHSPEGGIA